MKTISAAFVVFFCLVSLAWALEPMAALQAPIDEVIEILADPKYKGADQKSLDEQRDRLWKIINETFDFTQVAKRALGRNWKIFTVPQRRDFRDLFAQLLGNIYLSKIQGNYSGEKVAFDGQDKITDTKAVVYTKIKMESGEIPISYSVLLDDGKWQIYDVGVEGVSLVKNYRSQFAKILMKDTPDELIETLRKKVESQEKE